MSTTSLVLMMFMVVMERVTFLASVDTKVGGGIDPSNMSDEKRLIKELLHKYDSVGVVGRPVFNHSQTIRVKYGISLIQILDLNEKDQVLTTNVWSRYEWNDILLVWDPILFGGVDTVRVPPSKIWTPDIVLYNYADIRLKEQRDAMAVVTYDGVVTWIPPAIYKSTCAIDITHFPFDIQKCKLKFGSWTYDGWKLDINMHSENQSTIDIGDYTQSNEWKLIGCPAKRNVVYYTGLTAPYPDITFWIEIQRVAIFHKYILVLPCVLLSFLTLVIFWLPPESPAKVMLGMGVFVAFFVLLIMLAESTPPAAHRVPLMSAYFCMNMILITLSTFLAIIIIQTHIRGDRKNKVPPWLKRIAIDGLARVLCMTEFLDDPPKPLRNMITGGGGGGGSNGQRSSSSSSGRTKQQPNDGVGSAPGRSGRSRASSQSKERRPMASDSGTKTGGGVPNETNFTVIGTGGREHHQSRASSAGRTPAMISDDGIAAAGGGDRSPVYSAPPPTFAAAATALGGTSAGSQAIEADIREIRRLLKAYMTRVENKDAAAKTTKEWRIVARVLDRLMFFCYCGAIVVSLFTIFPRDIHDVIEIGPGSASAAVAAAADAEVPTSSIVVSDYND